MPIILGLFGFIVLTLIWLAWVVVAVVSALVWLVWPLALLVLGGVVWRRQARNWHAAATGRSEPPRPFFKQSGNAAFDEYRGETLRRLDDEREKFREFLQRLRKSKDKADFDSFMADRRDRPAAGTPRLIA